MYSGASLSQPLYSLTPDGQISDGTDDSRESFFQEYKYKLEKIYDSFYTARGKEIAKGRQESAVRFYRSLLQEVRESYCEGRELLHEMLDKGCYDEKDHAF